MLALRVEHELRLVPMRILLHQLHRELRPLDAGARNPEAVGEVAQRAGDRPPRATHTRLAHARFLTIRRGLLDHEIEWHVARDEIGELAIGRVSGDGQRGGERQPHGAIHTRHRERRILERLHQHATLLRPVRDALALEQVPRQPVYIADIPGHAEAFGVHVVRGEMITPAYDEPFEVPPFPRHAVQRLDAAHHRERREQLVVAVHDQLSPRPLHRQRFHRAAVPGESTILDQAARLEMADRLAVGGTIERDRQLEGIGAHAQIGAGERHAFRITGELELRLGGTQCLEANVAIAQDEHAPARDAPVHATGHLQNLIGAEMHAREHVAAAIDDVREARVVDDDRVEPWHIERTLPGGGHRQEERLGHLAFEEGANHADRLAAMIVCRRDARETAAYPLGRFLHAGARG